MHKALKLQQLDLIKIMFKIFMNIKAQQQHQLQQQ